LKAGKWSHPDNFMTKDVRRVMLKFRLLHEIAQKPSYSYELFEGLCKSAAASKFFGRSKAEIKNDIYNTINALEEVGLHKICQQGPGRQAQELLLHNPAGKEHPQEVQALLPQARSTNSPR
jgi:hypothetical protein